MPYFDTGYVRDRVPTASGESTEGMAQFLAGALEWGIARHDSSDSCSSAPCPTSAMIRPMRIGILIFLCLLSGCSGSHPENELIFRTALFDDPLTLDPAIANDVQSMGVISNVYEPLYHYDSFAKEFRAVPLLAASMPEILERGKKARIRLRDGVRFADHPCFPEGKGRALEARDFIFAWKRLLDPAIESQGGWIFEGRLKGAKAYQARLLAAKTEEERAAVREGGIEGLRAPDAKTIELDLAAPDPRLTLVLTMPGTSPMPEEVVRKCGVGKGALPETMVGTGPFRLKEWKRGNYLELEANPAYREEALNGRKVPALAGLRYEIIKEQSPAWLKFKKGELDLLPVPKDQFKQAIASGVELTAEMKNSGIQLHVEEGVRNFFLQVHMRDPILGKNKRLRQALSLALPRQEFIDLFAAGKGSPMRSALPPGILDRPGSKTIRYDFDPARARKLLAEAGYPEGKGLPEFKLDLRGADSTNRQIGEWLERKFLDVGIRVKSVANTFPAYLEKLKGGNYQIAYAGWAMDYPDAEDNFQLLYGPNHAPGPNDAYYQDPAYDSLFRKMTSLSPGKERALLVQKLEDIVQEEVPWIYLYDHRDFRLSQPWVKDYRGGGEMILDSLRYVQLDPEERAKRKKAY